MAVGKQFGSFTLLRKVARGGMADIFLATRRTRDDEELCIIKMIVPDKLRDPRALKLFLGEARLAALLDHPNIATIMLLDRVDDYYFIAMEYVPGKTLFHLLHQATRVRRAIRPEEATAIVHQCCLGLTHAHSQTDDQGAPLHLVHRDISPSNLILSFDGRLKIVDFGIAAASTRTAGFIEGKALGKYGYMSPEQCRGKKIDRRSDIFSLGVVYWELVTGGALFHGGDPRAIMDSILDGEIPPPTLTNTDVPAATERVIMTALAKDPRNRFQSAEAMGDAAREAVGGDLMSETDLAELMTEFFGEEEGSRARQGEVGEEVSLETLLFDDLEAQPPVRRDKDVTRKTKRSHLSRTTLVLLVVVVVLLAGAIGLKIAMDTGNSAPGHGSPDAGVVDLGTIMVDSSPRGASIFFQGVDTRLVTPAEIGSVPVGEDVEIGLVKAGFDAWSGKVRLESCEPRRVSAVLTPKPQVRPRGKPEPKRKRKRRKGRR